MFIKRAQSHVWTISEFSAFFRHHNWPLSIGKSAGVSTMNSCSRVYFVAFSISNGTVADFGVLVLECLSVLLLQVASTSTFTLYFCFGKSTEPG